jgi:hypothetical protein
MSTLRELESAVKGLSGQRYDRFRKWFLERDWALWDRQIEADSAAGRLDFLVREARGEKDSGKLRCD